MKLRTNEEILKEEILEKEKSRFKIDLRRSQQGKLYISISQSTFLNLSERNASTLRIRTSYLEELIQILTEFQAAIRRYYPRKMTLTNIQRLELINRYLNKCLEIDTLAVQFNCSVREVKHILAINKLVITSNKLSNYKPKQRFWRGKRRISK